MPKMEMRCRGKTRELEKWPLREVEGIAKKTPKKRLE